MKGLVGQSDGMQTQGFGSMPGYAYQSGGGSPSAPMGPPSWVTNPSAPIAQPGGHLPVPPTPGYAPATQGYGPAAQGYAPAPTPAGQAYAPAPHAAAPGAPGGASAPAASGTPAASGYVEPPPPPIFDASGAIAPPPPPAVERSTAPATPATPATPAGAVAVPAPSDPAAQKGAMLLVRAMVAAAAADGTIDDKERSDILGRLAGTGVGPEEQAELAKELEHPRPLASLVAEVEGPEMAQQFYAVSLLAISVDNAAEKLHMRALAGMLGLSADDVARIHSELGAPPLG